MYTQTVEVIRYARLVPVLPGPALPMQNAQVLCVALMVCVGMSNALMIQNALAHDFVTSKVVFGLASFLMRVNVLASVNVAATFVLAQ
tara:strand:+ start:287 stop:550 length:264 start_codon:yes stop_codon:yes gene_type:complete